MVCDGLKGLPDTINTVAVPRDRQDMRDSPVAQRTQLRVRTVHGSDRQRQLRPILHAAAMRPRPGTLQREFTAKWCAISAITTQLARARRSEFHLPFLDYDVEIRRVITVRMRWNR
ncbi:MAG: hypothetical protein U0Q20_04435 [Mycobacterium sp.]